MIGRPVIRPRRIARLLSLPASTLPSQQREQRHSSWLELFFDLAFALALLHVQSRLGTTAEPEPTRVLATLGLFAIVWWAWTGQAFYDTRFDPDDVPHRLIVLLIMAGAGALALGAGAAPYTLLLPIGYLIVRGSLIVLYLRVRGSSPEVRRLTTVYLFGFGSGWLLWLGSLAAPAMARPVIWLVATAVEFLTPWLGRRRMVLIPVDPTHLPERLGLFTIILLGVTLSDLLTPLPARPAGIVVGSTAAAFVIPVSVWWLYTTFVTTGLALPRLSAGLGYSYVHGLLFGALLLLGWALEQTLQHVVTAGSAPLSGMLRVLLGGSMVAWTVGGLALQWVSLGFLRWRRIVIAAGVIVVVGAIMAATAQPTLTLVLLDAALAGYAWAVGRQIARVSGERSP